jgi:hypothetical protein
LSKIMLPSCNLFQPLMQTSSAATIFMPHSLGTNGMQLNHTRSMSLFDLELYDQASAVLPIIQRKYFNIALTFLNSPRIWTFFTVLVRRTHSYICARP